MRSRKDVRVGTLKSLKTEKRRKEIIAIWAPEIAKR